MNQKGIFGILVLIILALLGSGFVYSRNFRQEINSNPQDPSVTASTTPTPTNTKEIVTTLIDEEASALGIRIIPIEIIEESRCPKDVQCIQAGTVRVNTRLISTQGESDIIFTLNTALNMYGKTITLIDVTPEKISTSEIPLKNYHFIFEVRNM